MTSFAALDNGCRGAGWHDGGAPKPDALYSWARLRKEPAFQSQPAMVDRCLTYSPGSLNSDRFPALGRRLNCWNVPSNATGPAGLANNFLLSGAIASHDMDETVPYGAFLNAPCRPVYGPKGHTTLFAGQLHRVEETRRFALYHPTLDFRVDPVNRYATDSGLAVMRLPAVFGRNWAPVPVARLE